MSSWGKIKLRQSIQSVSPCRMANSDGRFFFELKKIEVFYKQNDCQNKANTSTELIQCLPLCIDEIPGVRLFL